MQIHKIKELLPSHPSWQHNHQRHSYQLHWIRCFIEIALLNSKMILLTIFITFNWKTCHTAFKYIITNLPALIFIKFVQNLDNCALSIGQILNLNNFSKNPSPLWMFTVNELIFMDLFFLKYLSVIEMVINKRV